MAVLEVARGLLYRLNINFFESGSSLKTKIKQIMTFEINLRQWKQSQNNCFVVKTSLCSFKWLFVNVFLIITSSIYSYPSFHSHIHYLSSYGRIFLWQQYANEILESNFAWLMYWIKWDRQEITNIHSPLGNICSTACCCIEYQDHLIIYISNIKVQILP